MIEKTEKSTILPMRRNTAKFGKFYKLATGNMALSSMGHVSNVDTTAMSATATISTPRPDRTNDSLDPMGCVIDEYRMNPVVFWDHGFDLKMPIGRSEDHRGNCTVEASDRGVTGTCYFTDKFREAEQIFELVAEKTIRATSVRFDPITAPQKFKSHTRFRKWNLLEWSWVGIGCNPEAVSDVLAKNHLAGSQIAGPIFKSLSLMVPPRKLQIPGFSPEGSMKTKAFGKPPFGKKPADDDETEETDETEATETESSCKGGECECEGAKCDRKPGTAPGDDDESIIKANDESSEGEAPEAPEATGDDMAESPEGAERPYGAQLVEAVFVALTDLRDNVARGVPALENPAIKTMLKEFLGGLEETMNAMDGAYQGSYGKGLTEPEAEPEAPEEIEQRMKSFLARSARDRFYVGGAVDRLKGVLASGGLSIGQRKAIEASCRTFSKALDGSRHEPEPTIDHGPALASVVKSFREANQALQRVAPRRR